MRFSLEVGRWYACEFVGDEFIENHSAYSPIRIDRVQAFETGQRLVKIAFYHANYPEGVRDKVYTLKMIERGERFLLARSVDHSPTRMLKISEITAEWLRRYFPELGGDSHDIQGMLSKNA